MATEEDGAGIVVTARITEAGARITKTVVVVVVAGMAVTVVADTTTVTTTTVPGSAVTAEIDLAETIKDRNVLVAGTTWIATAKTVTTGVTTVLLLLLLVEEEAVEPVPGAAEVVAVVIAIRTGLTHGPLLTIRAEIIAGKTSGKMEDLLIGPSQLQGMRGLKRKLWFWTKTYILFHFC